MLAHSFCAFLSFWVLVFVGFFLLYLEAVFTSFHFSLTANVSHGTLNLVLYLVGMYSAVASKWALTKFSYSSFGVCVFVCSCRASYLFLSANVYSSPVVHRFCFYSSLISQFLSRPSHSVRWSLFGSHSFVGSVVFLPWQFGDRRTYTRMRSKSRNYSISC